MAFVHNLQGGVSNALLGVGAESQSAAHVTMKPIPYAALGHYRAVHRAVQAATQAANSRLFTIRNPHASNLIVLTRLSLKMLQTVAGTAQMAGIDVFRVTSYSVTDTTNTVTPVASPKRGTMATSPGAAVIRGVTVAGASAGMTGGTLTKDGGAFFSQTYPVAAAAATSNALAWGPYDLLDDTNGTHPFVLATNEGIEIENRTLNTTSFGVEFIVDVSWAEVGVY
jgi:hypothetical protein